MKFLVMRPVTVNMLTLGLILLGWISWNKLPKDLYPDVVLPQLTIVTRYANAAPQEVESLLTRPVEEAISTTRQLKSIFSISREGVSLVNATFSWGTQMDFAALEIREKLDLVKERLPREAEEPVVKKINPFDSPMMILSLSGKDYDPLDLKRIAETQVKDPLQKIPGVASVVLVGGAEKEYRVDIDPDGLQKRGLDLMKVIRAVKEGNVNYPAGSTKEQFYEVVVRTLGEFKGVRDIENTVISDISKEARPFNLQEVADVREGLKERLNFSRYNGAENVSCLVYSQSQANLIKTTDQIKEQLKRLTLPKSLHLESVYDKSEFIQSAISNVKGAAVLGGILAFAILFLFLGNVRSALVIGVVIPVSIATTLLLMFLKGMSLNMVSMGGMALGIGMLFDNAIVILENVMRHRSLGAGWQQAALTGTKEVAAPLVASTITSVAVFLPMIFLSGIEGELFRDLAYTVIFALSASLIVAFILLPRWLAHQKEKGTHLEAHQMAKQERYLEKLKTFYVQKLEQLLDTPKPVLKMVVAFFILSLVIFSVSPQTFFPSVDQKEFFINMELVPGSSLEATESKAKEIETKILKEKGVESVAVNGGSRDEAAFKGLKENQARFVVRVKKGYSTSRFISRLKKKIQGLAPIHFSSSEAGMPFSQGKGLSVEIRGHDLDEIKEAGMKLKNEFNQIPEVMNVTDSSQAPSPEIRIKINKERSALYRLSSQEIAFAAQAAVKGVVATQIWEEGKQIEVRVRLHQKARENMASLKGIHLYSPLDEEVPLDELAFIESGMGPSEIERLDGLRLFTLFIQPKKGKESLVEEKILSILQKKSWPEGIQAAMSGETRERKKSFHSLWLALMLAVVLVYMILAAQFESLFEPFLILFTIPFALIGVAFVLYVTSTPLSVMVLLGLILLGGIVVNNGIILIQCIHDRLKEGALPRQAVIEAGTLRLRPILMSMLTTVLALIPFLYGTLQAPMALTLASGLLLSTFLTLFLLPLFYLKLDRFRGHKKDKLPFLEHSV